MSVDFYGMRDTAVGDYRKRMGVDCGYEMNLCNANAVALLRALGLTPTGPEGLVGEMSIEEARRGVIRARNVSLTQHTRSELAKYGRSVARAGGVVELRPLRAFSPAFTESDLLNRVERFSKLVEEAARHGATRIVWS